MPGATIEVETPDGPRVATATTDGGYALRYPDFRAGYATLL